MSNTFLKDLNTTLTNSHYPHLTNKLFTNLTLPHGLMVTKQKDLNCTNFTICNTDSCIDDALQDKLISLINSKSKHTEDSENKKHTKEKMRELRTTRKKEKKRKRKTTHKK